jgi:hypothetical protein
MPMNDDESAEGFTFEKGLRELGERIRQADGIVPLEPGEIRPPGYYLIDHYWAWGLKPLPPRKNPKPQ